MRREHMHIKHRHKLSLAQTNKHSVHTAKIFTHNLSYITKQMQMRTKVRSSKYTDTRWEKRAVGSDDPQTRCDEHNEKGTVYVSSSSEWLAKDMNTHTHTQSWSFSITWRFFRPEFSLLVGSCHVTSGQRRGNRVRTLSEVLTCSRQQKTVSLGYFLTHIFWIFSDAPLPIKVQNCSKVK